jgi:ribosomal protein L29
MMIDEIRELTDDQLERELDSAYRSLQNLRFRLATKQLTNTLRCVRPRSQSHGCLRCTVRDS